MCASEKLISEKRADTPASSGHLDFGETPEQCAIRETQEEVGIEIKDVRFIAATNDFFLKQMKNTT
ncbi:MAG: NUDIX domain-containing protein [Bacteroidetes bacterium]|nr:NUDIX domain-containing protein [Bacteroidota bacterium]